MVVSAMPKGRVIGPSNPSWPSTESRMASADGPCTAIREVAVVRSSRMRSLRPSLIRASAASTTFSRLAALHTRRKRSGASRATTTSSTMPPASLQIMQYRQRPDASAGRLAVSNLSRRASAWRPEMNKRPMWETSNMPTPERTALASARMPLYCKGISHPAKGTNFAPISTWLWNRPVRFRPV